MSSVSSPSLVRPSRTPTRSSSSKVLWVFSILVLGILLLIGVRTYFRYATAPSMSLPVREFSNAEYPEDPANRSIHHGKYKDRKLKLVRKDATHFDFVLESNQPHVANVVIRNVDVSLMTPSLPEWTKKDAALRRIALTDRQWNRQQVAFGGLNSPNVEVTGGDGFEAKNLLSAELAKNCLNAGLWEIQLFVNENNGKALYYQGWFTFPLGFYKEIFEQSTGLPYWRHWYYLEHWFDPEGTPLPMQSLREVVSEQAVAARFDKSERIMVAGEQIRKRKTTIADNLVSWNDVYERDIRFASFIPPGHYSVAHEWKNKFPLINRFDKAILRKVVSPATPAPLSELELVFSSGDNGNTYRFFASGFDLAALPQLPVSQYHNGMYMPMGIGIPPFAQSYADLQKTPPSKSPYVSVLLDKNDRWINHHTVSIDGAVLHRDEKDPGLLHVYLLSYERHTLLGHIVVPTASASGG